MTILLDDFQQQQPRPEDQRHINLFAGIYAVVCLVEVLTFMFELPVWNLQSIAFLVFGIACLRIKPLFQYRAPQRVLRYWQCCAFATLLCLGVGVSTQFVYLPNLYEEVYPVLRQLVYWAAGLLLLEYYSGYNTSPPFWQGLCALVWWWMGMLIINQLIKLSLGYEHSTTEWISWSFQFIALAVLVALAGYYFFKMKKERRLIWLYCVGGIAVLYLSMQSEWFSTYTNRLLAWGVVIASIIPLTILLNKALKYKS